MEPDESDAKKPLYFRKGTSMTPEEEDEMEKAVAEVIKPPKPRAQRNASAIRQTQAETLADLVGPDSLAKASTGECFLHEHSGRRSQWLAVGDRKSPAARYLRLKFREVTGRLPSGHALTEAMQHLQARAEIEGVIRSVHTRVARVGDEIWIDMNDAGGHVILIHKTGWSVRRNDGPLFRRPDGMLPLPLPLEGGTIDMLKAFLNFDDEDTFKLIVGWLIGNFVGRACAHLLLLGEQGSAKTMTLKFLRLSLDPNAAMMRPIPGSHEALLIAAQNSYVLSFDNLSRLNVRMADAMCRLATGEAFSRRKLYADRDETLITVQRPCIFTGILDLSERPDLLDRMVIVRLPRIASGKRRAEAAMEREFLAARPHILGAIYSAVSYALAHSGEFEMEEQPRLLDFAEFVEAAAPALGWRRGDFTRALLQSQEDEMAFDLDGSPICLALIEMLKVANVIHKTPSQLYVILSQFYKPHWVIVDWPRSPDAMSREFRKMLPALRREGVEVTWSRDTQRWITVRWIRDPGDMD